jgi:hypothetical protein
MTYGAAGMTGAKLSGCRSSGRSWRRRLRGASLTVLNSRECPVGPRGSDGLMDTVMLTRSRPIRVSSTTPSLQNTSLRCLRVFSEC